MAEPRHYSRKLPTDVEQVPIVWRYELLKYLRSRRLYGALAIVALVVALIFILPPATGNPYNGTDRNVALWVTNATSQGISIPGLPADTSVAFINRSVIVTSSLEVFQDGVAYPSAGGANWLFLPANGTGLSANIIIIPHSSQGHNYTATYSWHSTTEAFANGFIGFANFLIVICATFFGADAIVSEYQARTGYLIFPNPLKRATLYLGKFGASMTAGILVVTVFYIATGLLSAVSVSGVDKFIFLSYAFALEYLLAATAIAYLISSVMKGATGSTVLTFFLFVLILPIIDSVGSISGFKASWSVTFSAGVIQNILTSPYPVDSVSVFPGRGITLHSYIPDPSISAIVMLLYALLAVVLSMVLFRRKEMTG